jgi:hypothetical protein
MNVNENKQIDNLARKVIKKALLESPSVDFTTQIMTQVSVSKQSEATVYKPLISKTTWFVIAVGFSVLVAYSFLGTQGYMESSFDFSILANNKVFAVFSRFTFSKTLLYALVFLSVMVLIQVSFLTSHFNKRFEF